MQRLALAIALALLLVLTPTLHGQEDTDQFIDQLVASLTPTEKIGQLVMVEFMGFQVGPDSPITELIRDYKVGAVHYNSLNCNIVNSKAQEPSYCQSYGFPDDDADPDTPAQVAALSNALQALACQAVAPEAGGQAYCLPLFVSIDHEGDDRPSTHLRNRFTPMPSQMAVGAAWDEQRAEAVGCVVGQELAAVGVNMLLGPVADVLEKPISGGRGDMGIRVFGGDPAWVAKLSRAYVRGVHQCGQGSVLTVTKHFPGHGGSTRDIEDEVAVVPKSLDELKDLELVPFGEVARLDSADPLGVTDAMMTSHLRYPKAQGSETAPPVSLDPQALGQFMSLAEFSPWRQEHLLMADALGVRALRRLSPDTIGEPFRPCDVAKAALMAGNDLLPLVPWYPDEQHQGWQEYQVPNIKATIDCLAQRYTLDRSFQQRVDDAVKRVVRLKLQLYPGLSLDEALVDSQAAASAVGNSRDAVYDLAADALTLVHPSPSALRSRLPRAPTASERILFVECWSDPGCSPPTLSAAKGSLEELTLRLYGPTGTGQVSPQNVATITFSQLDDLLEGKLEGDEAATVQKLLSDADWLVFALADYSPDRRPASGAVKKFLASSLFQPADTKKVIAIAYNSPYHLDATEMGKLTAYFAVYSKSEPFREVSIRALFQ
ncbi:MAG: glycoside hydrolase family 3 N-terminal domain-containing protein, partial [Chloroflexota bacterium]|nr:glycoside hydrolase family 3 N-terminal domain-containing protein [Chloroflexota bacterium]